MRLFIALWPDAASAAQLAAWASDAHALCGGRQMAVNDMHMTLAFLGDTPQARAEELMHAVRTWHVDVRPFVLQRFGMFARARVVWAGPADDEATAWLHGLYDTLWGKLAGLGWHCRPSGFTPHISLLRGARVADLSVLQRPPVSCIPERCVLVASRPAPDRSRYQVLAQLPLA